MRVNSFSPLFGLAFMKVMSLLSSPVAAECCYSVGSRGNLGENWCAGSSTRILSNPSNLDGSEATPFCGVGSEHPIYLTYQV